MPTRDFTDTNIIIFLNLTFVFFIKKTRDAKRSRERDGLNGLTLTPHHYIKSGGSYYKPFDVAEGFLPTFTLTHIPAATTKHKRPKVYPAPEREGS